MMTKRGVVTGQVLGEVVEEKKVPDGTKVLVQPRERCSVCGTVSDPDWPHECVKPNPQQEKPA